jgi:hypothetical protein
MSGGKLDELQGWDLTGASELLPADGAGNLIRTR